MILKIVNSKSCYGGEIIKEIKVQFGFEIAEGTLDPILKK